MQRGFLNPTRLVRQANLAQTSSKADPISSPKDILKLNTGQYRTEMFGIDGKNIGPIEHLMIDKHSGKVAYAVMEFGGFLGLGEEHHPVPWW